jgi:hypothetical protein
VEAIHKVRSVDVVRYPASTKGLYESEQELDEVYDSSPRSHFRAAIMSVLDDTSLSMDDIGRKIMTILKAEEKVLGKPDGLPESEQPNPEAQDEKAEGTETQDEGQEDKGQEDEKEETTEEKPEEATETTESQSTDRLQDVSDKLDKTEKFLHEAVHRVDIVECLLAHRVNAASVSSEQMTQLREQKDREAMDKMVESWPASFKFGDKPEMPAGGGEGTSSFDAIREEMSILYGFKK